VLLSTLGAAGTIIGAALGSVVVTLGSALYSSGLRRSRESLARAQSSALQRVGAAQAEVRRADRRAGPGAADPAARSDLQHAEDNLARARRELDDAAAQPSTTAGGMPWRARLAGLPWRRIGLLAAALFVLTVVLITVFELLAGRSVASYTGGAHGSGGTSITQLDGPGGGAPTPAEHSPGDQQSDQPTTTPSPSESSTEPSPGATTSPTPSAPSPTTSPPASSSTSPSPEVSSPVTPGGLAPVTPTP